MIPLLNLPRIPRDQILKQWSVLELFHLSMLSKRSAAAVEDANIKVDRVHWITHNNKHSIDVHAGSRWCETHMKIYWIVDEKSPCQGTPGRQQFTLESLKYKMIVYMPEPTKSLLEYLSELISKIFKTDNLMLHERSSPLIPNFWQRLNIRFESVSCLDWDDWKVEPVNSDSVKFLLDNIKTDSLYFQYKVAPGFQYTKPLKFKVLRIINSDWFTLDNLLNTECEFLRVENSNLTKSDLLEFFDKWKEGCFPKLKIFRVFWPEGVGFSERDLEIEERDDKGRLLLTDVNGNRGTFMDTLNSFFIGFTVE